MDVFGLRDRLIGDYRDYTSGFLTIRDERIRHHVEEQISQGLLWPDPKVQLSPSFEPGAWVDDLVDQQVLHPEAARVFRRKEEAGAFGERLRLHRHQVDAIEAAGRGGSYVLTTGTGATEVAVGASTKCLDQIYDRRNRSAHTGDRSGRGRAPLAAIEVDRDLKSLREIVEAMQTVTTAAIDLI